LLASLALSGCGGVVGLPDSVVTPQVKGPAIQGSVFGGHAPITGAHVYLLQPGTTGIGSPAISILGNNGATSAYSYALTANTSDPNVPVGAKYVTSDSSGDFNLTGAYTCAVGQPVYTYAYGGFVSTGPIVTPSLYTTSRIVVSNVTGTGTSQTATYTFTVSPIELLYVGENVTLSGFTTNENFSILNGAQVVLGDASLTTTTFSITATTYYSTGVTGNIAVGTYATADFGAAGIVSAGTQSNASIVQLATLGNCPSSGNFSTAGNGALSYIYMNEISTVATAYTFQPFTVAGNNNAWNIGSNGNTLALQGIANAAATAAQLYDIQGSQTGHIANFQTVGTGGPDTGNGAVPQTTLDTLGNILAACVDSAPTSGLSAQCSKLFVNATDNGLTVASGDTAPTDTATAAINIARYPAGNHSAASGVNASYVSNIYGIPTGDVPFTTDLGTQPLDFTVAITYNIEAPGGIAIDSGGNAFVPTNSTSGYVTKLSPAGAVPETSATGGSGFNSIAIDPSGNVFVTAGSSNDLYEYTSSLGAVTGSPWGSSKLNAPTSVAIDSTGYVYVADGGSSLVQKFNNSGSLNTSITNSCLKSVSQIAIDASDYIWATVNSGESACRLSNPGGSTTMTSGSQFLSTPGNVAIDSNGDGWVPAGKHSELYNLTPSGGSSSYKGGGLSSPMWVAIDGGNNVWVANGGSSTSVSEFSNAGTAITGTSGYQSGNLNNASFIAIDGSGDVWIPNQSANTVTEIIGAAAPTVTPLSALKPGILP
jgi:hypothetical protein